MSYEAENGRRFGKLGKRFYHRTRWARACLLRRTTTLSATPRLTFEAGTEPGRAWELTVYADNTVLEKRVISSTGSTRQWETFDIDLAAFAGRETTLRLYQRVFVPNRTAGNALWRKLVLQ